jgi:crossover junction endodeoxyribonuclease RuvC
MKNIYVGIDPGADGGIATITVGEKEIATAWPYSNEKLVELCFAIADISGEMKVTTCLEKVGAMPGQGVTSMFNFGKNVGFIEGVLSANYIPYQTVPPQKWKKEYSISSDKNKSIEVCKKLFPSVNLKRTDKCKKDHDGMAEALLMAEYARRNL